MNENIPPKAFLVSFASYAVFLLLLISMDPMEFTWSGLWLGLPFFGFAMGFYAFKDSSKTWHKYLPVIIGIIVMLTPLILNGPVMKTEYNRQMQKIQTNEVDTMQTLSALTAMSILFIAPILLGSMAGFFARKMQKHKNHGKEEIQMQNKQIPNPDRIERRFGQ